MLCCMDFFNLIGLFWWTLAGIFIFAIWQKVAPQQYRVGGSASGARVSIFAGIFSVLLVLTVIFFFNQIWNDIGSFVSKSSDRASSELMLIFVHTAFVIPILIIALAVLLTFYRRGETYSVVTVPYFIGATMVTVRLLFDVGSWVIREYQKVGIYLILGVLLVIFSVLAALTQHWWQRTGGQNQGGGFPSGV